MSNKYSRGRRAAPGPTIVTDEMMVMFLGTLLLGIIFSAVYYYCSHTETGKLSVFKWKKKIRAWIERGRAIMAKRKDAKSVGHASKSSSATGSTNQKKGGGGGGADQVTRRSVPATPIALPEAWSSPFELPSTTTGSGGGVLAGHKALTQQRKKKGESNGPIQSRVFEAAGEVIQQSLWAAKPKKQILQQERQTTETKSGGGGKSKERLRTGGVKLKEEDLDEDWYAIMGITEERAASMSAEELKTVYRKRCLETHPDKMKDHDDTMFKKVKRGYEMMCDEASRRAYASSRYFDDSIPSAESCASSAVGRNNNAFYTLFDPVFERNKMFSMEGGLPSLGDDKTPIREVKKFYDSWYRFRSWRDFSTKCKDLEEVHEEMDRNERRYFQKRNQTKLDRLMRDEMTRIRTLVDRANANDPRIIKDREDELATQEATKKQREAERVRVREEATRKRKEAEDKERRAAADKILKEKEERDSIKDHRQSITNFFEGGGGKGTTTTLLDSAPSNVFSDLHVTQKNITWLSSKRTGNQLREIFDELKKSSTKPDKDGKVPAVALFNSIVVRTEEDLGQTRYGEACKTAKQKAEEAEEQDAAGRKEAKGNKKKAGPQWDDADLLSLGKAVAKFPGGTVDRWRRIGSMLPDSKKFSEEQILWKVKQIESGWKDVSGSGAVGGTGAGGDLGALGQQKAPNLGKKHADADGKAGGDPSADAWTINTTHPGGTEAGAVVAAGGAPSPKTAGGGGGAATAEPVATVEDWTLNQQKQLEEGLRAQKDNKGKDKYVKVAAGVEGKTAKQCFDRFKYLCALNVK